MHRLVFENGEHGLGAIEQRMAGPLEVGVFERVDHATIGFGGKLIHFVAARPAWWRRGTLEDRTRFHAGLR